MTEHSFTGELGSGKQRQGIMPLCLKGWNNGGLVMAITEHKNMFYH